jgi:hypothetical protein
LNVLHQTFFENLGGSSCEWPAKPDPGLFSSTSTSDSPGAFGFRRPKREWASASNLLSNICDNSKRSDIEKYVIVAVEAQIHPANRED